MKFILIIFLFFTSLLADRDGGPYLGLGYGISQYDDNGLYENITENQSTALIFYAGAYINKHLSVEFNYVDFNTDGDKDTFVVKDDSKKMLTISASTISTLAHYAFFDDKLDFYARFGAGEIQQDGLETEGFTMVYGVGMGYRFNNYTSIKFAYDNYQFGYDENSDKSADYRMQLHSIYTALEIQF
ncbi:MAG: outer membrane beta-barrel protein [Campylobacterota bacterium]|nr:outer membrane beta-barrel protein [Campylobacterota bacterium]